MASFHRALDVGISAVQEYVAQSASMSQSKKLHESETGLARELHEKECAISWEQHEREMKIAREFHENELAMSKEYHTRDHHLNKQIHIMSTLSELERHFAQLDADLVNAAKESERDMFDQRNQQLQTLIVSASVMMAALSTLLIQGLLPQEADDVVTIFFGAANGMSLSLLFLCLVLCIEILRLSSTFMVHRAESMSYEAEQARKVVKEMFKEIRVYDAEKNMSFSAAGGGGGAEANTNANANTVRGVRGPPGHQMKKDNSNFLSIQKEAGPHKDPQYLEKIWNQIEKTQHEKVQKRLKMNDAFTQSDSFEKFWIEDCKFFNDTAIFAFYLGTAFFLFATILWAWSEFLITYKSQSGAIATIAPLIVAIPVGFFTKRYLNANEEELKRKNSQKLMLRRADVETGDTNNGTPGSDNVQFIPVAEFKTRSPQNTYNKRASML